MRFVAAQNGARRGYAVPALLEDAGMLERFYTDVCGNAGMGLWLDRLLPGVMKRGAFARLLARRVPETLTSKTHTFAWPFLIAGMLRRTSDNGETARFRQTMKRGLTVGDAMARHGFGKATHLYIMMNEFPSLILRARSAGIKVVSEIYSVPSTECILAAERARFPGWEPPAADRDSVRKALLPAYSIYRSADHFICPSDAVQADLIGNWGVAVEQTAVVPYGVDARWLDLVPQPVPGRVLFAGTADLRKGIHYLAAAAELLKSRRRNYEFIVAGEVSALVLGQPCCRWLKFLGRVPRQKIWEQFQSADLLVLPSLAEGSAEVTYEALAAALPVVTTPAAGSVVRDGIDGVLVPEREPEALAAAIERIVEDRALRQRMASAARERALEYTWDRYGQRLIQALLTMT